MRTIAFFTSTRADYGLLRRVIPFLVKSSACRLRILASGTHLSPDHGMTIDEITQDGFAVDETVEILLASDTPTSICRSMGLALMGYGDALSRLKPDILVILGDRFESFCAAAAAQVLRIPVAHIHGGETTEGVYDEAFRHSITKMSHLHFAACEVYRRRIIQLGESPNRVFHVGALGVENVRKTTLLGRTRLKASLEFDFDRPYFLVTFHPVTLEASTCASQFTELLAALRQFRDHKVLFTKSNADTEGRVVHRLMDAAVKESAGRWAAFASLGTRNYLSVMKHASAVIGNSSSGILEAPALRVPTVNIGDRQKGRIRPASVVDCNPDRTSIVKAIRRILKPTFQQSLSSFQNPYAKRGTAHRIADIVATFPLEGILKKQFFRVGPAC